MTRSADLSAIQNCISNSLGELTLSESTITGVVGDAPSQYSRSPSIWQAAFAELGIEAVYLPFDTSDDQLPHLLTVLRQCKRFWGANITVPHKLRIMEFLDEIDPGALRIDAVNTIVRTQAGRLIGYNTDGEGFVQSILQPSADRSEPFISSLAGMNVLLIGAGGSARAVAFHIADLLVGGKLLISNRTLPTALALADNLRQQGHQAFAISEAQIGKDLLEVGLIINSTTKGQGGIRQLSGGRVTNLEPYSALAPAHPPAFPLSELDTAGFAGAWLQSARPDIETNHEVSFRLANAIPRHVRFYDLIYHPEETVFLRHGRLTGHLCMNGKGMIIHQAAIAFYQYICREHLKSRGIEGVAAQKQILNAMERAW
ncbi:MAG TPA: shikimate dehydrogenase [Candidatus Binatia bacterium]|nr:shikimate dehydrogenase [Candidatus Binatia bacterium]